jgi:hypothetical protein
MLELNKSSVGFSTAGILQAESIAGKSIVWFSCEDLLERCYTAFVRHGRFLPQSIIARQRRVLKVPSYPKVAAMKVGQYNWHLI